MNENLLKKYARLIAETGANVQKDQNVVIRAQLKNYPFALMVTEECYKLGACRVVNEWDDQCMDRMNYTYQTVETMSEVPEWKQEKLRYYGKVLPAHIYLIGEDPDGLKGIDMEKVQKARQISYPIVKPLTDAMENKYQWTIAAVPDPAWAKKVFPGLEEAEAVEKLWQAILATVHITEDNDPVQAWKEHNAHFDAHSRWLNAQQFEYVTYKSANGTDFRADLIPEGQWCGGKEDTIGGVTFNPNMPTEEIFTSPMQGKCEGTLISTKPLSWNGMLVNNFSITFENGKAVSWQAETGKEVLDRILSMDEGCVKLGELALVPQSSPICRSGILYYETLFDENASCHVALGSGFNDCIRGYKEKTDEECKALGINDSMIHVDFMVGAPDLCITGWKNGNACPIFVNGEWAEGTEA